MSIYERMGLIMFLVIVAVLATSGISIVTWEFWVVIPMILVRDILIEMENQNS